MTSFPTLASERLGIEHDHAEGAARAVLSTVGDFIEPERFDALCATLAATETWLPTRQGTYDKVRVQTGLRRRKSSTTGLFGASGQSKGGVAGLLSSVRAAGVREDQAGDLLRLLVGFLRERAGKDVIEPVFDGVPALRLLGN